MRLSFEFRLMLAALAASAVLSAQVAPSRVIADPPDQQPPKPATPPQPAQPVATQPQNAPATSAPRLTDSGAFIMPNASLTEMIDLLAKRLKINYILDPAVRGTVSIFTYGEVKPVDYMPLLETMLRVNGSAMVKVGDTYRIVPVNRINQLPLSPMVNIDPKTLPDDERMVMNLIFLKYATAAEILNLVKPFLGEGAFASVYDPANLLLIEDNARSMKRTMDLIALFDSDQFAGQRVRLFEVENSRPSDLQHELDLVFKAYALSDKAAGSVKFIPVDRINTIIAVAPNPGIFTQVENWIAKLDIAVKASSGSVNSYVYRLKYARADTVAMAIMALYSGNPFALMALGQMAAQQNMGAGNGMGGQMGGYGGQMGGYGGGGYGGGGYGGGGYGGGGYGGGGYGGGGYGGYGGGGQYAMMGALMGGGMGGYGNQGLGGYSQMQTASPLGPGAAIAPGGSSVIGQTGEYLGAGAAGGQGQGNQRVPHVIPNPFDNTILIQGTPQEYGQILGLLRQLDIPPRQVLIDAKIYEVDLKGAFAAGVTAYLEKKDSATGGAAARILNVASGAGGVALTTGALVLRSHELLAAMTASETKDYTRVISAPSIIATDSIPASMNVGDDVPVLTSQAVGGVTQGGNSLFTNTVSSRSSGVTLNITARVNSSGIVTMMINQNVSSPQAAGASSAIQSPSFSNRSFQTQITVQDGDTVAIGGIIQESNLQSSAGVPFLHKLPGIGALFGAQSITKSRTELIIFLTPRVIYDTNQMVEATDEIRSNMKRIQKLSKEQ
jgi:general secretion pathway protein D